MAFAFVVIPEAAKRLSGIQKRQRIWIPVRARYARLTGMTSTLPLKSAPEMLTYVQRKSS